MMLLQNLRGHSANQIQEITCTMERKSAIDFLCLHEKLHSNAVTEDTVEKVTKYIY